MVVCMGEEAMATKGVITTFSKEKIDSRAIIFFFIIVFLFVLNTAYFKFNLTERGYNVRIRNSKLMSNQQWDTW